jgi:hypothetical protein
MNINELNREAIRINTTPIFNNITDCITNVNSIKKTVPITKLISADPLPIIIEFCAIVLVLVE